MVSPPQGNIEVSVIMRSTARPTLADALGSLGLQHGVAIEVLVVAACGATHPPLPSSCGPHPLRLVTSDVPAASPAARHNGVNPIDVDVSGGLTSLDALLVINFLNSKSSPGQAEGESAFQPEMTSSPPQTDSPDDARLDLLVDLLAQDLIAARRKKN